MSTANGFSGETRVQCDVINVGGGLSGISALWRLRKLGLKCKVFEAAPTLGGVWYWNRYPGARVDSETPFYQLNIPEVWKSWSWSCRYPDQKELLQYVHHCNKALGVSQDTYFDAEVISAVYDSERSIWTVKTILGHVCDCLVYRPGLKKLKMRVTCIVNYGYLRVLLYM